MIPKYLHLLFIQLKVVATKIYPLIVYSIRVGTTLLA